MTCERYWSEGILLHERGAPDPHRETCQDCQRAHRECLDIIEALPLTGGEVTTDPDWQVKVHRRIARAERPSRSRWYLGASVGAASAAALALIVFRGGGAVVHKTHVEVIPQGAAMRSTAAHVGDRIRITAPPQSEIRVYRADRLEERCAPATSTPACTATPERLVGEMAFGSAGDYQIVVIDKATTAQPEGSFDRDLSPIVAAGGSYELIDLTVR